MLKKTIILSLAFGFGVALLPMVGSAASKHVIFQPQAFLIDDMTTDSANLNATDSDNAISSDADSTATNNDDSNNDDALSSDATE